MEIARPAFALFAALLACAACSPPAPVSDASTGDASSNTDGARGLVMLPPTASGVTAAWCGRAIDAEATGMRAADTLTVRGSTAQSNEEMAAPCNQEVTGQQLFRYQVRGDNVAIRATTNLPGGTPYLDTVLWVISGACSENSPVVACNDDDGSAEMDREGTSTLVTPALARGTELVFVVGAYARAHRGAAASGDFTLQITELPAAPLGQMCDSSRPGGCVVGAECAASSVMGGVCVTPTMEHEPNNTPADAFAQGSAPMITGPIAIHAALEPAGDVDCFAFAVAAGTNLWIEASDGAGSCGLDLRADLYRMGETDPFDGDDDTGRAGAFACPRIFPGDNAGVRAMPAGTYVVCVKASEPSDAPPMMHIARYSVQIAPADASGGTR